MKARSFAILVASILLASGSASAQDIAPTTNATYETVGNFVYARQTFLVKICRAVCHAYVTVTVRCPSGYVALGGGYRSSYVNYDRIKQHESPYNVWADEPTRDGTGWSIGIQRVGLDAQLVGVVVTCALATQ